VAIYSNYIQVRKSGYKIKVVRAKTPNIYVKEKKSQRFHQSYWKILQFIYKNHSHFTKHMI